MVKKLTKLPKPSNLFTFENVVGLLLAILIIFDLKLEEPLCKLLNTNMGKVMSFVVIVLLFIFVHPIIGILFLIYIYQCSNKNYVYSEQNKYEVLQNLNPPTVSLVEEEVILNLAPIKNQNKNNNVEFTSYLKNVGSEI